MGNYRVDSLLIMARRGAVYRATDQDNERLVAMRVFKKGAFDPRGDWRRVPEHPNIARVEETGSLKGQPYAIVERLDGPTFAMVRAHPVQLVPLAGALATAQRGGILHGHLRLHNVHLEERGPVIADYGFTVRFGDQESRGGFVSGLAPEQIRGLTGTVMASDIYGLGVIAYTALAGRPPFDPDEALPELVRAIQDDAPPRPSGPAELVDCVLRMLAKFPRERPSADDVLRVFARTLR